ncbi:unnamed protein product [Rhizoctonia solani]|nr:unnamed protein product [Rhizoctonia solani]
MTNVHTLSIELSKSGIKAGEVITLDHESIKVPDQSHVWFHRKSRHWQIIDPIASHPSGPLSSILNSAKPIALVIPADRAEYYESIALRIAHNLYTYLKLDCAIVQDSEVDGTLEGRSVVHHLYMDAFDPSGYERILRMFPLRTGVPGPEWMIVGPDCDTKGYGGVLAAGFWDRDGELSGSMSYFS